MTTDPRFERQLREAMTELAAPGDLATQVNHALAVTARSRPLPRWRALLQEPTMRTQSVLVAGSPPMRWGLLLTIVALVALLAGVAVVGSRLTQGPALPPAYGPAGNGLIAYAIGGEIVTVDAYGTRTTITGGPTFDSKPQFSRDGTRIAFLRTEPEFTEPLLMVANADGSNPIAISERLIEVEAFDWSPSGDRIVVLGQRPSGLGEGNPLPPVGLAVYRTDGSGSTNPIDAFPIAVPSEWVGWRPPTGDEILFRGVVEATGETALYAVAATGGTPRPLMETMTDEVNIANVELSPDGRWASFWNWGPNEAGEVDGWGRILDLDSGSVRLSTTWGGSASPFTPDSLSVIGAGATSQWVLEAVDGTSARAFGPTYDNMGGLHAAVSPDGTELLVTTGEGARTVIDIANGTSVELDALSAGLSSWQRIALP